MKNCIPVVCTGIKLDGNQADQMAGESVGIIPPTNTCVNQKRMRKEILQLSKNGFADGKFRFNGDVLVELVLSNVQGGLGFESDGDIDGCGGGQVGTLGVGLITVGVGVFVVEEEHWDNRNLLQILWIPIGETK